MASSNVDPPGFPSSSTAAEASEPNHRLQVQDSRICTSITRVLEAEGKFRTILAPAARIAASTRTPSCTKPIWQAGMDGLWKDCSDDLQFALEEQYQANCTVRGHMFTTKSGLRLSFYHNMAKMRQTNLTDGIVKKLRRIESTASPLCF